MRNRAPGPVRAAGILLAAAPVVGFVLTSFATWALNTVPAGVESLQASLTRHDRSLLRDSWVLHSDQPATPVGNLSALFWLGLAFALFLPLSYFLQQGFRPARVVTYILAAVMLSLTITAVVADENFADPDPGRLSPDAFRAWQALFPPGYPAIHDTALLGLITILFGICVLLDRPASRAYFRHRQ